MGLLVFVVMNRCLRASHVDPAWDFINYFTGDDCVSSFSYLSPLNDIN